MAALCKCLFSPCVTESQRAIGSLAPCSLTCQHGFLTTMARPGPDMPVDWLFIEHMGAKSWLFLSQRQERLSQLLLFATLLSPVGVPSLIHFEYPLGDVGDNDGPLAAVGSPVHLIYKGGHATVGKSLESRISFPRVSSAVLPGSQDVLPQGIRGCRSPICSGLCCSRTCSDAA